MEHQDKCHTAKDSTILERRSWGEEAGVEMEPRLGREDSHWEWERERSEHCWWRWGFEWKQMLKLARGPHGLSYNTTDSCQIENCPRRVLYRAP
jgi:hypothetical protein